MAATTAPKTSTRMTRAAGRPVQLAGLEILVKDPVQIHVAAAFA